MEVKEFAEELKRMCYSAGGCNSICPLHSENYSCPFSLYGFDALDFYQAISEHGEIIEKVEQWSKEHPRKTRMQDFFEKFPNAPKQENGMPRVCAAECGYTKCTAVFIENAEHNIENCRKCWNEPVE